MTTVDAPVELLRSYVLRHGDRALVLSQRLTEWLTHAPELEEEVSIANIALDLLGQARMLYTYAGAIGGDGRTEDDFAYWRDHREFTNVQLVEQPNGDFATTMVRQVLHDLFAYEYWSAMCSSADPTLAGLAGKAVKETTYHVRHSSAWVIRLGDGTEESHRRAQSALDGLWRFTGELFETDEIESVLVAAGVAADPTALQHRWSARVDAVLAEATLTRPAGPPPDRMATGGRRGLHSEAFAYLVAEMQTVARAHPGATW